MPPLRVHNSPANQLWRNPVVSDTREHSRSRTSAGGLLLPDRKWRGGYIRNSIYWIDLCNHRHKFSTKCRDPKSALAALERFYQGEGAYLRGGRAKADFGAAVVDYLAFSGTKNSKKHVRSQAAGLDRWDLFLATKEIHFVEDITPAICHDFQQWRMSGGAWKESRFRKEPKRQLGAAAFNRDLACLTALVSWAKATERLPEQVNPFKRVKQLPEHRGVRPHREVPKREVLAARKKLIEKWADTLTVLYGTAFRWGSLRRLTLGEIDHKQRIVRDPKPKGHRAVEVRVSKAVLAAAIRCTRYKLPDDEAGQFGRRLEIACRKAGVTRFTAHDLRVSSATYMHRQGTATRDIQQLLGHASLTTTERYVRASSTLAMGPI